MKAHNIRCGESQRTPGADNKPRLAYVWHGLWRGLKMARIDQIGAKLALQAALNPAHGDIDRGIDAVLHGARRYVAIRFEANRTGGGLKTFGEDLGVARP